MSFVDEVAKMDATCLREFGVQASGGTVVFRPQDGSGDQVIDGIIEEPAMQEDFIPGSVSGTSVLRLFVTDKTITPFPRQGDLVVVSGVEYVLQEPDRDLVGASSWKLRVT